MNIIEEILLQTLKGQGDSDRHLTTLLGIALGSRGKTFIELGVRNGDTTLPLLYAAKKNDGILYSVDIEQTPYEPLAELKPHWSFHKQDAIKFLEDFPVEIPIDLVYIDDWHSYEHVKKELDVLDRLVSPSTIILVHDLMYGGTTPFYHSDLTMKDVSKE